MKLNEDEYGEHSHDMSKEKHHKECQCVRCKPLERTCACKHCEEFKKKKKLKESKFEKYLLEVESTDTVRFGTIKTGEDFLYKGKKWRRTKGKFASLVSSNGIDDETGKQKITGDWPFDVDTKVTKL